MGCFSFKCKKSKKPVLSSSFSGDAVHLFLLKDGVVIEHMFGNYDSYGRVFKKELRKDVAHHLHDSFQWATEWGDVCNLIFSDSRSNGIAAILAPFWKEGDPYPKERSDDDPNQGWGSRRKELLYNGIGIQLMVEEPFHKIYEQSK